MAELTVMLQPIKALGFKIKILADLHLVKRKAWSTSRQFSEHQKARISPDFMAATRQTKDDKNYRITIIAGPTIKTESCIPCFNFSLNVGPLIN